FSVPLTGSPAVVTRTLRSVPAVTRTVMPRPGLALALPPAGADHTAGGRAAPPPPAAQPPAARARTPPAAARPPPPAGAPARRAASPPGRAAGGAGGDLGPGGHVGARAGPPHGSEMTHCVCSVTPRFKPRRAARTPPCTAPAPPGKAVHHSVTPLGNRLLDSARLSPFDC